MCGQAWNTTSQTKQKGVVYIFKPDNNEDTHTIKLKGLDEKISYIVTFEDGTNPNIIFDRVKN